MRKVILVVIVALMAVAYCSQEILAGPLPSDPAALAPWQGTQSFLATLVIPDIPVPPIVIPDPTLRADVEFAVYAPGSFSTSAALGNPADPSGGEQYVYAYQVFNLPTTNPAQRGVPISELSVGFLDLPPQGDGVNDDEQPQNIGFLPGFGLPDAAPTAAFNQTGSDIEAANWRFEVELPPANTSSWSTVLIYTSPFGPEWDRGSLLGGGMSDKQRLPSPTPEPATLALALLAGACLVLYQRVGRLGSR
ncbi:MAG: hypothetical protein A2W31_07210 [Planctomycetes bacterium RBG_16_64_10]|nr:MAG: hypothetical protein A2W31_07210 [Planctomycetes bacterium RBG_16_64_10]